MVMWKLKVLKYINNRTSSCPIQNISVPLQSQNVKYTTMNFLGNLVWLIMGGLLTAVMYWIAGLLMCITIIGIPFGVQLFKIGTLALWPFGHDLTPKNNDTSCLQVVFNVLWILLGWWEIALTHLVFGLILCCTIVGIPWGVQHFKLAIASVFPFGKEVL